MSANCPEAIAACYTRVAMLDVNGSPLTGAQHGYITDGLVQCQLEPEYEQGKEFIQRNGCGNILGTKREDDHLKRIKLTVDIGYLDYELIYMLIGGTLFRNAGATFGFQSQSASDVASFGVSFEVWQQAWDGDAQAANSGGIGASTLAWHHHVFPKVKFQLSKLPMTEDFTDVTLIGYAVSNPRITINGPFDDWPTTIKSGGGITKPWGMFFDGTTPTVACGSITVPSAAS